MSTIAEHLAIISAHNNSTHKELSKLSKEHGKYVNEWLLLNQMHVIIDQLQETFNQRLEKQENENG